ncbi:DUF721 domain-containing protein [Fluviicola sp.]|jgi:hypothetical protein|uniref:DUF721 domain-containing protein n=1 Tax=Fluviicola sp. TaxID=1917219 RepID=UPI0028267EEC|nr:DUF721 domain-containing protein [Fluviicola sp.]MDR0803169.1 DUF721 domain-containing protein [Fluviicola sp.]
MSEWDERKRSGNAQPMKDLVDKLMSAYQLKGKLTEIDVLNRWEEMMGKAVAVRTTNLQIRSGVLIIRLNSSVMRDELLHGKQIIIERVNQTAGKQLIRDVWFE